MATECNLATKKCIADALFLAVAKLVVSDCFVCSRVPLLSVFLHLGAVLLYDFNHPSEY